MKIPGRGLQNPQINRILDYEKATHLFLSFYNLVIHNVFLSRSNKYTSKMFVYLYNFVDDSTKYNLSWEL